MSIELEQNLEHMKARLLTLQSEQANISRRVVQLQKEIDSLKQRDKELESGYGTFRSGLIQQAERAVAKAERDIQDASCRKVVWKQHPSTYRAEEIEWVVVKVTKKRIYVRRCGCDHITYCNKETGADTYRGVIDLDATFPEGVENFKL